MAVEIKVPALGESVTEATVSKWMVKAGDQVAIDQPLCELETDQLIDAAKVRRVVLCSGKVYFDLVAERRKRKIDDIAIMRIEQLYPFPISRLAMRLSQYPNAEVVWCQEEPQNMGAWGFVDRRIERVLAGLDIAAKRPRFAGRAEAASPATGLFKRHRQEQAQLVDDALAA